MIRNQIYLEQKQIDFLKQLAYQKKSTMSDVVRDLINEKLPKDKKKKNSGQWALEFAAKAEKMNIKGPIDLSTNSDKYLY